MNKEKKNNPEKPKDNKSEEKKRKMDRELRQTFPASDPPSRTRPGHNRTEGHDS